MAHDMRALVIGGSGFIGSYVVDEYLSRGCDVTVYDQQPPRFHSQDPRVALVRGDLNDHALLDQTLASGFDVVAHCAYTTSPATSNDRPQFDVETNVIGTINLLDSCVRHGKPKIVFLSSAGTVYGHSTAEMITEDHPTRPISSYGITKLAIEHYLFFYHQRHGLEYVALRVSNPYGPRQNPLGGVGAIAAFVYRVASDLPIEIWGDGCVVRDFIFVEDVAKACVAASIEQAIGVFNIGSSRGTELSALVQVIGELLNRRPSIVWMPARPFDVQRVVLDCSRARRQLAWTPTVGLRDGIALTHDWIRRDFDTYVKQQTI